MAGVRVICPICETDENVLWEADGNFDDIGIEGNGVLSMYECKKCGTRIEIYAEAKE